MISLAMEKTSIGEVIEALIRKGSDRIEAHDMGNIDDWRKFGGEETMMEVLLGEWYNKDVAME